MKDATMADDSGPTPYSGGMPGNPGAGGGGPGWAGKGREAAAGDRRPTLVEARAEGSRDAVRDDPALRRDCGGVPATGKRKNLIASLRIALALAVFGAVSLAGAAQEATAEARQVEGGMITDVQPNSAGVRSFKGIPFAAPPIGALRWRAPQPVKPWRDERSANQFEPKCMQTARLGNIDPLNPRMSEDCLYLNVWTPAKSADDRLPVMVWIYGGSFNVGAGSEPWYDGTNLAKKGVIVVTLNYRVDVFGFLSHPELTAESNDHSSGNYGLMDQMAALGWVKRNIAAFGGDPGQVTIFGKSAGSLSVSALMASPLGRGLFQRAIGESGAMLYPGKSPFAFAPLAKAEQSGVKFADILSAHSIAELRKKPADELLEAVAKNPDVPRMSRGPIIDGHVLPVTAAEIFAKGQQTDVPLLAGSNADEGTLFAARGPTPTPESFTQQVRAFFGDAAELGAEDISERHTGPGEGVLRRTARGPTHRLPDLALERVAGHDRKGAHLPLPVRAAPPRARAIANAPGSRGRISLRRDRVRLRQSPGPRLALAAGGSAYGGDCLGLLGELRQEREPERTRLAGLAGLHWAKRHSDAAC